MTRSRYRPDYLRIGLDPLGFGVVCDLGELALSRLELGVVLHIGLQLGVLRQPPEQRKGFNMTDHNFLSLILPHLFSGVSAITVALAFGTCAPQYGNLSNPL